MYLYHARRLFLPWTLILSCLLSFFLFFLTGGTEFTVVAQAARNSSEISPAPTKAQEPREETTCLLSTKFPKSITQWCSLITKYSRENNIDPNVIAAVVWQESGGNPAAYSASGAVGLMQVMPKNGIAASFNCSNGPCFKDRPTIAELQDPEFNLAYGTRMLSKLAVRHGNLREALKAYGPMQVGYYYADKVLALFEQYGK
jgi:hypothetical protein